MHTVWSIPWGWPRTAHAILKAAVGLAAPCRAVPCHACAGCGHKACAAVFSVSDVISACSVWILCFGCRPQSPDVMLLPWQYSLIPEFDSGSAAAMHAGLHAAALVSCLPRVVACPLLLAARCGWTFRPSADAAGLCLPRLMSLLLYDIQHIPCLP